MKKLLTWVFQGLFKALGLHDRTKQLLLVFIVATVLQLPFSLPGLWRMGWGMWLSYKNDTLMPTSFMARTAPTNVGTSEDALPRAGPTAPKPAHRYH